MCLYCSGIQPSTSLRVLTFYTAPSTPSLAFSTRSQCSHQIAPHHEKTWARPCTTAPNLKELHNSSTWNACPPLTFILEEEMENQSPASGMHQWCNAARLWRALSSLYKREQRVCAGVRWRRAWRRETGRLSATKHTNTARWCNSSQLPMVPCWKDEWSRTRRGRQWRCALSRVSSVFWSCGVIHTWGGKKRKMLQLKGGGSFFPSSFIRRLVGLTVNKGRWGVEVE